MLTLLALALLSQNGCQPGGNCQATSFYPTCQASSTFPTCNTSQRGRIRCALTAFDGGTTCQAFCDGTSWACVASGGSSGTDTCTGVGPCLIGGGGIRTDGGVAASGDIETRSSLYARETSGGSEHIRLVVSGANHYFDNGSGTMFVCSSVTGVCVYAYAISANTSLTAGSFVQAATFLKSVGVATASLPTCNAGAAGQIETDTDLDRPKFCDGAQYVYPVGNIAGTMPGLATIAAADAIVIGNQRMYSGGNVQRIGYAGVVGGTGGGTYTIDVYNNTAAAVECVTGTLACNAGSIGSVDCANASYAAFDDLRIRINCSGCTTCPYVNVNAEYQ